MSYTVENLVRCNPELKFKAYLLHPFQHFKMQNVFVFVILANGEDFKNESSKHERN